MGDRNKEGQHLWLDSSAEGWYSGVSNNFFSRPEFRRGLSVRLVPTQRNHPIRKLASYARDLAVRSQDRRRHHLAASRC